jgi:hypothetical protein
VSSPPVPCKLAPVSGRRRKGSKNGNYKHGRYTEEVAATRRWLREANHMLRKLDQGGPDDNRNYESSTQVREYCYETKRLADGSG